MCENLFDRFSKDYDDSYQRAPGRIKSCSTRKQEIPMDWQRILLVEGIGEQDKIKDFFNGFFLQSGILTREQHVLWQKGSNFEG
jgi:hypothetical protein